MAWTTTLVNRLRMYIGDLTSPQLYIDSILEQFIAIAAITVINEVDTRINFIIDTDVPTINPDPVTDSTISEGIGNLFVIKAACIISMSEVRKDVSKYGIKIRDDLTSYDGTSALTGRLDVYKAFLSDYEKTKYEWEIGNRAAGRSVFGPYSSANYPRYSVPGHLRSIPISDAYIS